MQEKFYLYEYWAKVLGLLIILFFGLVFYSRFSNQGILDFNGLAMGISLGLLLIFFSKEKKEDEMVRSLKFKALSRAVIVAFFGTYLFNYLFLNWNFDRQTDLTQSISAYEFLAVSLLLAIVFYQYFKYKISADKA
ncbi:hypothetical protein LAG90_13370 [Marinilongibacter aquaticus]|uniref:hypothetical protein n=1 Tax=Marinilongibacter aquaticus TaxID=2975157 RepID=UPI0021BDDA1B|nr:hypothetical protein [Marinilongibacter aquaticus]UBM57798.1 hypothetical protein LAG90_13370 [Marinilongibacter aquaticus]